MKISPIWYAMVALVAVCLANVPVVHADPAEAWISFEDKTWISPGGDVVSGPVQGVSGMSCYFASMNNMPIEGANLYVTMAPNDLAADIDNPHDSYLRVSGNQIITSPVAGELTGDIGNFSWIVPDAAKQQVDLPITIERIVGQPILTNDVQTQSLTVNLTVNQPFDPSVNYLGLFIPPGGEFDDVLSYQLISEQKPQEFFGDGGWYDVNPADLQVGQTYPFQFDIEVSRFGPAAGAPAYHKPRVITTYGYDQYLDNQVASEHTFTAASGTQARFAAEHDVAFYGYHATGVIDIDMPTNFDFIGPAAMEYVRLARGNDYRNGQPVDVFGMEVQGQNIASLQMTTPTGRTFALAQDGPEAWVYEMDATDPALFSDLGAGTYTLVAESTDGSGFISTTVELADASAPLDVPTMIAPTADLDGGPVTLQWLAAADPSVNLVWLLLDGPGDEMIVELDASATSYDLAGFTDTGSHAAGLVFINGQQGINGDGVEFLSGWYGLSWNHINVLDLCGQRATYGDFNCDGQVALLDLDILGNHYKQQGALYYGGDSNGDGAVALLDLDILGRNFNTQTPIPEPGSLACLTVALFAIFKRK